VLCPSHSRWHLLDIQHKVSVESSDGDNRVSEIGGGLSDGMLLSSEIWSVCSSFGAT
jgi:hypothetical protein